MVLEYHGLLDPPGIIRVLDNWFRRKRVEYRIIVKQDEKCPPTFAFDADLQTLEEIMRAIGPSENWSVGDSVQRVTAEMIVHLRSIDEVDVFRGPVLVGVSPKGDQFPYFGYGDGFPEGL